MRILNLVVVTSLIAFSLACGGKSGVAPTAPTSNTPPAPPTAPAPPPSATVRVDVIYYTNDRTTDPDHFSLSICPSGSKSNCRNTFTANPAARTPGSITWTGSLAPGTYTAMVELYFADRSIDIAFASVGGGSTGGVERNSIRFKESNTSAVNTYAYRPCGVTTSFTRRPDLPPVLALQTYVAFDLNVTAASAASTC